MLDTDGKKLRGRFIKNKSTLLKKVSLVNFSFQEVSEGDLVETDNMNRNIIHSKYHSEEEQKLFKSPKMFEIDLQPASTKRPLLMPIDFTPEWEEERKANKSKPQREDEEFNLDFTSSDDALSSEKHEIEMNSTIENTNKAKEKSTNAPISSQDDAKPEHAQSIDMVGNAINNLVQAEEKGESQSMLHAEDPTVFTASLKEDPSGKSVQNQQTNHSENDDFIPAQTAATDDIHEIHDPEDSPSIQYQNKIQSTVSQEELKNIFEEAKAQGYEEGYKIGEQKAEFQTREKTTKVFGKVGEIVKEFELLKHSILDNVQQNFYEITQAIAETLLKRELKLNPAAFAEVIRKAIEEAVEPNTFKIHVHPEMYMKVKDLKIPTISDVLVKDDAIETGDFRIESDLSVVDGNIKKVIADLLEQADLNLFESDDSDEKAS